ncbi:MAG: proprotein convertase P-domain-containing protein [Planctomycetota bacterium]
MSALDASGAMVKAANLPNDVQVVQGVGSKTLLRIDHEQWGRSTVELSLPETDEVWLEISFDDRGRAIVSLIDQSWLIAEPGAPPAQRVAGGSSGDCGACPDEAVIPDGQVGLGGRFYQLCEDDQWMSFAFPIQTDGADVDTVVSVFNSNDWEGDIYIMGGTCNGPDVNDIYGVCCCGILGAPPGVPILRTFAGGPFPTADTDPTWVVLVPRGYNAFFVAFDSSTLGRTGAAYGNLSGLGNPGEWQDLNNFGFGACYFVDLTLTGDPPSECECPGPPQPPANDDCENAEALDVASGGTACIDGTTINATFDPVECVAPTTAPGVWYRVIGTGNGMRATTCEDYPPAGADYDTKISVFCGECLGALSNCCEAHSGQGCDDPDCEAIVCAQDAYCCNVSWDSICASQAETKCGDLCAGGGTTEVICVAGNDDACTSSSVHSTVEWCSQAGAEYYILVHGFGFATGNFTLCVSDDGVGCPYVVECIPGPPTGACCQCDEFNQQFCTLETEEDCAALGGELLGLGEPCEAVSGKLSYTATPGLVIPDGDPAGLSHTMTVGASAPILDLNVGLVITHTWVGDLCVTLRKDGGDEVTLIERMGSVTIDCDGGCCGCSADDFDIILDDEAAESIEDQCTGNLTGSYTPEVSFFDGLTTDGDWTLFVHDVMGADFGTLVQWSLHFEIPDTGVIPCEEAYPDQCLVTGSLDIKPGSCPNSFNSKGVGNGKLPVALVGTGDFDVTMVDPDSLLLSRADGVGGAVAPLMGPPGPGITISDTATPFYGVPCDCHELAGDGIADLNMKFHRATMTDVLELGGLAGNSMVELVLTGSLTSGQGFEARDCIRLVAPSWGGVN